MNIDPKNIACFGFTLPKKDSWYYLLHPVATQGWQSIDEEQFEKSLNDNVIASYQNMVSMSFKDLDTDFDYLVGFDNQRKLWKIEMPDSSDDAIDQNDKKEFFKSELFKKTCKRADIILSQAYKSCTAMIMPEVKKGRFIILDEIKLEALIDMLNDPVFRKNLKTGRYLH